ncbi:hypothetical protein QZH46_10775 [Pseudomonas corrugata]
MLNGNLQAGYAYDQAGRVVQQQNAQGIAKVDYDLNGKATRSNQIGDAAIATDDRITYTRYDNLGRALEQHLPAFEANLNADTLNNITLTLATPIIRQSYDRWGNMLSRTDARGYATTYTYDHNNKQLTETLPVTDILRENGTSYRASLIHEKRYDGLGQLIQETDLVGPYAGVATSTELRTRQHVYNQAGELIRDVDALGYSRNYRVDSNGNRVATQDALGTVLVDSYDAMDRQLSHGIIRSGAAVVLLTNQYDQAGRLVGEINGSAAVEETLVSTANANKSSNVTGVAGNVRYTLFDERGNITKTRNESKVEKTYEYSEANRKVKEIDGLNNSLKWSYNEADYGRLLSRNDLLGRTFVYSYNGFGQVLKEVGTDKIVIPAVQGQKAYESDFYEGIYAAYTYYTNGLVRSVEYKSSMEGDFYVDVNTSAYSYLIGGERVRDLTVTQYKADRWSSNLSASAEVRYVVDELSRLKEIKAPAGAAVFAGYIPYKIATARIDSLKYSYDELGNRRRSYLDTTNQSGVKSIVDHWYQYDQEGRVTVNEGFLANGKVVAGKLNGKGKGVALSYDVAGRRLFSEQWDKTSGVNELFVRSEYVYNDLGRLATSSSRQITRSAGADSSQVAQGFSVVDLKFENIYDFKGVRQVKKTIRRALFHQV